MKVVLPTELISYPIVTSATIYEFTSVFRNADYYYQFFWPQVLMIYTPIFIAALMAIYHSYKNNIIKLGLTALIPVVILLGIAFMVSNELTDSFSPDIFFKNYVRVVIILFFVWIAVAFIDKYFDKDILNDDKKFQ